jgi:hypothetical protein
VDVGDIGRGTREMWGDKLGELVVAALTLVGVDGRDAFIALRSG